MSSQGVGVPLQQDVSRTGRPAPDLTDYPVREYVTAMALELGHAKLSTMYDASHPLVIGSQVIHDSHSKGKPLSLVEVFLQSSNIGSAREAIAVGMENHKAFLERTGLLSKVAFELPERAFRLLRHKERYRSRASLAFEALLV